ncbi:MAG: T9SS type A sorting domain-containing protein, partial [Bacteroidota bacterium]
VYGYTVTDANGCTDSGSVFVGIALACNGTKSGWPYRLSLDGGVGIFKQNNAGDDDRNWKRRGTPTPTSNTGPSGPAEGVNYRFIESSGSGNPGKKAILTTKKCLNLSNVNNPVFQFQYHMYGVDMGTLEVQVSSDGGTTWTEAVWKKSGDQGNAWYTATINLNGYATNATRLRIIGITGGGPRSDMAIDDIYIGAAATSFTPQIVARSATKPLAQTADFADGIQATVYPNPTSDILNIRLNQTLEVDATLILFNRLGQQVSEGLIRMPAGTLNQQISVADLPAGLYFLQILSDNGQVSRKTIVVNR